MESTQQSWQVLLREKGSDSRPAVMSSSYSLNLEPIMKYISEEFLLEQNAP